MAAEYVYIPHVIVVNILKSLPCKSLLRFKCVCQLWHSTISDPGFSTGESVFVFASHGGQTRRFYGKTRPFYFIDDKASVEAVPKPSTLKRSRTGLFVSNSCNGLVLIGCYPSLYLYNPSTRYSKKVLTLDRLRSDDYGVFSGLCYDPSIADYKALIWFSRLTPDYGDEFLLVATLKGKCWTQVSCPFRFPFPIEGPVLNGDLHWVVTKEETGHFVRTIERFDPVNTKFEDFPTPIPNYREHNAIVGLGVLDGCLCMSRTDFEGNVEILTMKEYGVVESWTTLFVISNLKLRRYYESFIPLIVTRSGEILFNINDDRVMAYNPAKKLCVNVPFPGIDDRCRVYATSLVQSLVSPIGYSYSRRQ